MRVLVFGNPIAKVDSSAVKVAELLEGKIKNVQFVRFDAMEDLEKEGANLIILDAVVGIEKPRLVSLEELELTASNLSLHGYDLAWSLVLLKKLGKLKKATIIGVPAKKSAKESLAGVKKLLLSL